MKMSLIALFLIAQTAHATANLGRVVGQMGLVEGEVTVDDKPVKKNAGVREGSVVDVKNGRATLLLGKGSVFNIGKDSRMVVTQYGLKPGSGEEEADLDLKFGRTRALILNQGAEKKDIKIRARAATMGVRGTEIFIDAPKDTSRPIQFFTLEGKAEVLAHPGAQAVAVNQNQGVSASGAAPTGGSTAGPNSGTSSTKSQGSDTTTATMTVSEVKAELKKENLESSASQVPPPPPKVTTAAPGTLSGQFGMGSLPPITFDPIQDRFSPLAVHPRFCNAVTGVCN